ncbi:MAG: DUF6184 family natural product biosynthesis lipoprotein [Polyangiaceae bacterium]|jgi:hypothetical protein
MNKNLSLELIFIAAVAVAACGRSYTETTTAAVVPSAPVTGRAIDAIASERCQREARCENIGANRHYVSLGGCTTELRGEVMNQLTTATCPNGVNSAQLEKCLAGVRGQRCENALDALDRQTLCATTSLCSR